jgi:hypothetical protein
MEKGAIFRRRRRPRDARRTGADDLNAYLLAIKSCQDAGQYTEALEVAGRAVSRFPQSARACFEYGFHLQKVGRRLKH